MTTNLPICDIELDPTQFNIDIGDGIYTNSMKKILKTFTNFAGADCWAITITCQNNMEIIYNAYDEINHSFNDIIFRGMKRTSILDDPHRHIFCHFLRRNKDTYIDCYMFHSHPYIFRLSYLNKIFSTTFLCSKEYIQRYHS